MSPQERSQAIELILSDVDGVLTDGRIIYDNQGIETKRFHVRDGLGVKLWQSAGGQFGVVTQRSSQIVRLRAGEMGISIVRQAVHDKLDAVREIAEELGFSLTQTCVIGDDLPDLAAIRAAGLGIAVGDAVAELKAAAHWTTQAAGGTGAVRETIEMILKNQGRWEAVIQKYY